MTYNKTTAETPFEKFCQKHNIPTDYEFTIKEDYPCFSGFKKGEKVTITRDTGDLGPRFKSTQSGDGWYLRFTDSFVKDYIKPEEVYAEMIKPKTTTKNKQRTSNLMTFHYKSGQKATVRGITKLVISPNYVAYTSVKHNPHKGFVTEEVTFDETKLIDYLELDFVGQDKKQVVFETSMDQMTFGEIKIFERQLKEIPDQVFTFNIDK